MEARLKDVERFVQLMREDPCDLYAHALREAAGGVFFLQRNGAKSEDSPSVEGQA